MSSFSLPSALADPYTLTCGMSSAEGMEWRRHEVVALHCARHSAPYVVEERGRLCLAAVEIDLAHPHTGKPLNVCTAEPEEWRIAVG